MSSGLSKCVSELSELIDFMHFYKTHITYFQSSIINILHHYKDEKASSELKFLTDCIDLCGKKDFRSAWSESVNNNPLRFAEATLLLIDFGNRIGTSDAETQIKYIDYYTTELNRCLTTAQNKERENKKLYIILGASAGLLSAIMII